MKKRKDKLILRVDSKQRELICAAIMKQHERLTEEKDFDSAANSARLHNTLLVASQSDGMYIVPLNGDVDRNWMAHAVYDMYNKAITDKDSANADLYAAVYNHIVDVPTEAEYHKEMRKKAYEQSLAR